jgi:hypothetical protein
VTRRIALLLPMAACLLGAVAGAEPKPETPEWHGLRLDVSLPRPLPRSGKALKLKVTLRNVSAAPVRFSQFQGFYYEIAYANGTTSGVGRRLGGTCDDAAEAKHQLKPGEAYSQTYAAPVPRLARGATLTATLDLTLVAEDGRCTSEQGAT